MQLQATELTNRTGGTVTGKHGDVQLTLAGTLDNQGGLVSSGGQLQVQAGQINNTHTTSAQGLQGQRVSVHTAALENAAGMIAAQADLQLTSTGQINNQGGRLSSTGTLGIQADGDLNNAAGTISSNGAQSAHLGALSAVGQWHSQGDLQLEVGQAVLNDQDGVIQATGRATLHYLFKI